MSNEKIAYHVSITTLIVNLVLSIGKLIAGIIGHSSAMISDAFHSASDVISTVIVMIGVRFSNKAADQHHPYGHERLECVAALLLSILLALTGFNIGKQGIIKILHPSNIVTIPTLLTLIAAVLSIIIKYLMYLYTKKNAIKISSSALLADSYHHLSDALSSIGAMIGIIGARNGYPIFDVLASFFISVCIIYSAGEIFITSINQMIDRSASEKVILKIQEIIKENKEVRHIDLLQTRLFGSKIYVDVEIALDKDLTLEYSHSIAKNIHDRIEKQLPEVKHCMIHVNPYQTK